VEEGKFNNIHKSYERTVHSGGMFSLELYIIFRNYNNYVWFPFYALPYFRFFATKTRQSSTSLYPWDFCIAEIAKASKMQKQKDATKLKL
jgi:hypothetical protein